MDCIDEDDIRFDEECHECSSMRRYEIRWYKKNYDPFTCSFPYTYANFDTYREAKNYIEENDVKSDDYDDVWLYKVKLHSTYEETERIEKL